MGKRKGERERKGKIRRERAGASLGHKIAQQVPTGRSRIFGLYRKVTRSKLVCNSFEPETLRTVFAARPSYSTDNTNFTQKQATNRSLLAFLPPFFSPPFSISFFFLIVKRECNFEYTLNRSFAVESLILYNDGNTTCPMLAPARRRSWLRHERRG